MSHHEHAQVQEKHSVMQLWPYIEKLTDEFDKIKDSIQPSSAQDAEDFKKIIAAMDEMLALGREARDLNWIWPPNIPRKAHLAKDTGNVFERHFGSSKLPPLSGEKTLKYILDVIIPFMEYTAALENEWWVSLACGIVNINFEEKVEEAQKLAGQNWDNVRAYEAKKQVVNPFAEKPVDNVEAVQRETPIITRKISATQVGYFAPQNAASVDAADIVNDRQFAIRK